MNMLPLILLISGCLATPIQKGSIQIIKYSAGNDGLIRQDDGNQQQIVWTQEQPIIMESAPLTYGAVKGVSAITEKDQQRHINTDEDIESREDVSDEDLQPENEGKMDLDSRDGSDLRQDDQRPVQTETAALLGSSIVPVKGGASQILQRENEQIFPTVVNGQRRLIEVQPTQYALGGKSLRPILGIPSSVVPKQSIVYQEIQQGLPLSVQQYKVVVKRPIVHYELRPVHQQDLSQELLRRHTNQVQSGSKEVGQQIQYVIQPVMQSGMNVVHKVPQNLIGLSQVQHRGQPHQTEQGVRNAQEQSVLKQNVDIRGTQVVPGVQDQQKVNQLSQKVGVKSPVQHSVNKVIVEESSRHVPVISGQRVVGYQTVGGLTQIQRQNSINSGQQQEVSNQQIISPQLRQQTVQYVPYIVQQMPGSDQQYYQVMQSVPVQSYGQQDDSQIISHSRQPSIIGYPYQYSNQNSDQLEEQGVNLMVTQTNKQVQPIQSIQGVQQIQDQTRQDIIRGQDVRVNQQTVNQRTHVLAQSGVKSVINV